MLLKFEEKIVWFKIHNFEFFGKKLLTFDKMLTPFEKTCLQLKQLFDAILLIYRLLNNLVVFQKLQ